MGKRARRRRERNAVSGKLTRGKIAAAVVALLTVAVLVALVAVAAPRWWHGDGGSYAPRTPLAHAEVTPARSFFGQVLTAHAQLVVDPRRVDPTSAELTVDLRPYRIRSESRRVTPGLGRAAVVDFRYEIQCVTRACLPVGKGRGADAQQLKPASATYRTRDGRTVTTQVKWPIFGVQSRLTADEIAASTPQIAQDSTQPPVSWAISPGLLGGIALTLAALLILGAGWLIASVVGGDTRLVRARQIPAHLTPIERALVLAEHAAARGEVDESRKALERLATELRRRRAVVDAEDAERLAWSEADPSVESVAALATSVRSNGAH
jgi:hypothetical protein